MARVARKILRARQSPDPPAQRLSQPRESRQTLPDLSWREKDELRAIVGKMVEAEA